MLAYHCETNTLSQNELVWSALELPKKKLKTNCIKNLAEVDENEIEIELVLQAFLLQSPGSKHHVNDYSSFPEAELILWENSIF